jgi:hypothetical protein
VTEETAMICQRSAPAHSVESATLADVLERVLDKGLVIAGDIRIKLVDIELLSIQIRLMIASVEKAKEMGMDWWSENPYFNSRSEAAEREREIQDLKRRIGELTASSPKRAQALGTAGRTAGPRGAKRRPDRSGSQPNRPSRGSQGEA